MALRDKLGREGPALAGALAAVLVAWAPVIAGARSVAHYDLFHEHVPFRAFVKQSLEAGELPLWAPGMRAGYPLHANGEAGLLSPIEAPLRLAHLPAHRASDAAFVLGSLLAAGFAFALGRALGMRPAAAALTAIGYGLSGRLVAAAWPNAAVVAGLAPALLLALERLRRAPLSLWPPLGVALALGATLLAGRPQSLVPILLLAGASMLGGGLRGRLRPLLLGLGLGFGLGAPQSLPTLAFVEASTRAEGLGAEERAEGSLTGAELPRVALALGDRRAWPEARAHVGVLTLALAVAAAVGALGAARRAPRRTLFFAGAALVALLLALGPATPLFALAGHLPVLGTLRVPARFLIVTSLGLAIAGGLGLDAFVKRPLLRAGAVALVAVELVLSAWATIPWSSPEIYTAVPRAVAAVQALPLDASGAPARFIGEDRLGGFDGVVGLADGTAVEQRDGLGGDRALQFGLLGAWGYGEPVYAWQQAFVPNTARRLATLGVREGPVLPRALVVSGAIAAANADEARSLLETVDPSRTVVLEDAPALEAAAPFEAVAANVVLATANRVVIAAHAPRAAWLVLHDAWDADWAASLNNADTGATDAPVLRAHSFFRAVRVPQGDSIVTFTYRPTTLAVGAIVGALAALAVALAAFQAARGVRISAS